MMKYKNSEYNKKRNEMIRNAGLIIIALGIAAFGQILVNTDSALVAAGSVVCVLAALGISSWRSIRA